MLPDSCVEIGSETRMRFRLPALDGRQTSCRLTESGGQQCSAAARLASALMRSAHHSHRIRDVAPFARLFGFPLVLARHCLLCGLRDRCETVRFEHLPSDRMHLNFGHHALCSYCMELGINHRAGDEFHYERCVTPVTANAVPKGNTAARN